LISIRSFLGSFFSKRKLAILLLGGILLSVGNFLFVGDGQADVARASKTINNITVANKMQANLKIVNGLTNFLGNPVNPNTDVIIGFDIKQENIPSNYTIPTNTSGATHPFDPQGSIDYSDINVVFEKSSGNNPFTLSSLKYANNRAQLDLVAQVKDRVGEIKYDQKYKAYLLAKNQQNKDVYLQLLPSGSDEYIEWYPPVTAMNDGIFISQIILKPNPGKKNGIEDNQKILFDEIKFSIAYLGKLALADRESAERQYRVCSTILYQIKDATQDATSGKVIHKFIDGPNKKDDIENFPGACVYNGYTLFSNTVTKIQSQLFTPNTTIYYKLISTVIDYGKLIDSNKVGPYQTGGTVKSIVTMRSIKIDQEGNANLTDAGGVLPENSGPTPDPNSDSKCAIEINGLGLLNRTAEDALCWFLDIAVRAGGWIFNRGTDFAIQGMETAKPDSQAGATTAPTTLNVNYQLEQNDLGSLKTAWKYTLGIVNFILLLILIVIGFGTIFHIQIDTYHIKAAIVPIIIGIVLANFSFLICRFFLDLSNVMTVTFVNSATDSGDFKKLGSTLADMIIPGYQDTNFNERGGADLKDGSSTNGLLGILGLVAVAAPVTILFAALVLLVLAGVPGLIMWVLGFLFYVRTILLFILIILSPIAFFCVWWPPLQGFFKKWWNQFIQWTFLVPVSFFFFWAGIRIYEITGSTGEAALWKYILGLLTIFLAASVPFKMGGAVGAVIAGYAKKYGTSALGVAKGTAWNTANRQMESRFGGVSYRSVAAGIKEAKERSDQESMAPGRAKASEATERLVTKAQWLPGLKTVGQGWGKLDPRNLRGRLSHRGNPLMSAKDQERARVNQRSKEYEDVKDFITTKDVFKGVEAPTNANINEQIARMQARARKHYKIDDKEDIERLKANMRSAGKSEDEIDRAERSIRRSTNNLGCIKNDEDAQAILRRQNITLTPAQQVQIKANEINTAAGQGAFLDSTDDASSENNITKMIVCLRKIVTELQIERDPTNVTQAKKAVKYYENGLSKNKPVIKLPNLPSNQIIIDKLSATIPKDQLGYFIDKGSAGMRQAYNYYASASRRDKVGITNSLNANGEAMVSGYNSFAPKK